MDTEKIRASGAAFNGNRLMGTRPLSGIPGRSCTKVVSLTDWCKGNFISKRQGIKLIEEKYLIAFRRHHQWWVCANPNCLDELLKYLRIKKLLFDADNSNQE